MRVYTYNHSCDVTRKRNAGGILQLLLKSRKKPKFAARCKCTISRGVWNYHGQIPAISGKHHTVHDNDACISHEKLNTVIRLFMQRICDFDYHRHYAILYNFLACITAYTLIIAGQNFHRSLLVAIFTL